ncbi:hypothetical protein B0A48_16780 [Cryoendolithus antarcticus]|uniref:Uncharacterized protein n=1 Tax=Cryoendolithus antarcticus TaxID=1507870 RepID=A0A1V8SDK1_9PEZI|nr:hypothetical protein B0A48_16780 [Cryoendolithus antarcticus]
MADKIHSTGRGGAGNIGEDPNTSYVESGITREGYVGEGRSEYSAGRGGAGNMIHTPKDSPALKPQQFPPTASGSEDYIPETDTRSAEGYENFHTGRGGGGNVHKDKYGGHTHAQKEHVAGEKKEGLFEKVKEKLGGGKHHEEGKETKH